MEAVILAGGLGSRLISMVFDRPKAMAPIDGRPFLEYLIDFLIENGVDKIVLSVGYKSSSITEHFGNNYKGRPIFYALEKEPLGTGGALKNAMRFVTTEEVVVANGDSLINTNLSALFKFHITHHADITLALKPMENYDRYGSIVVSADGRITHFLEKRARTTGLINAGLYIFNVNAFLQNSPGKKFSLEQDIFENKVNRLYLFGFLADCYFRDIGIPDDFQKAKFEIGILKQINKSWTLFLDRDGVINRRIPNGYIKSVEELNLLPGAVTAIAGLNGFFGRTVVVTNQQGIGKGLMTEEELKTIHEYLSEKVNVRGGKIDAFYFAPQLALENSDFRKPKIGMALKARKDFPEINLQKSIMIGDSPSDSIFAQNAGMKFVRLRNSTTISNQFSVESLSEFCAIINTLCS